MKLITRFCLALGALTMLAVSIALPAQASDRANSDILAPAELCAPLRETLANRFDRLYQAGENCIVATRIKDFAPRAQKNTGPVIIDGIDFGDNSSEWARDGECDDMRFTGNQMAVELVEDDIGHDAADCSTLYSAGEISLRLSPKEQAQQIDFGDDSSEWANDGECDDPRFEGPGSAQYLNAEDASRDATDCRKLFLSGQVEFLGEDPNLETVSFDGVDFGDNTSQWARDGECDDPRFVGELVVETASGANVGRDAYDCSSLYQSGEISIPAFANFVDADMTGIDFGIDDTEWANDNECDDPTFSGPGMALAESLDPANIGRDASDCQAHFSRGMVILASAAPSVSTGNIDFGDDSGEWPMDSECDDIRFTGPGMASEEFLLEENIGRDATDCRAAFSAGTVTLVSGSAPTGGGIDFGDDASEWSNDGECDDPRFEGPGSASVTLEDDLGHDATDCRTLYDSGQVTLIGGSSAPSIDFGDDSSTWANDGECDDPRFEGPGAASVTLEEDIGHDATDCRTAFDAGQVTFVGGESSSAAIDYGDDSSAWSNDGECDDPRFEGPGSASVTLEEDQMRDATDCRTLHEAGQVTYIGGSDAGPIIVGGIDFGDDASDWANNFVCDDPRFEGEGAASIMFDEDEFHDATDCRDLYESGDITLISESAGDAEEDVMFEGINFGNDSSPWANDGQCDDPRFEGPGVAGYVIEEDTLRDATDCLAAYRIGDADFIGTDTVPASDTNSGSGDLVIDGINFGDDTSSWANDGQCDDPRFEGPGTADILIEDDRGRDATDCSTLYGEGQVSLSGGSSGTEMVTSGIDFGDDTSSWANDGQCDDPRFEGPGTAEILIDADLGHDATDCRTLYESGDISLIDGGGSQDAGPIVSDSGISFGDDSSLWANDGECDDPRFEGEGMASSLSADHEMRDASDCLAAYEAGTITQIN